MRELSLAERLKRADWFLLALAVGFSLLGIACIGTASAGHKGDLAFDQVRWTVVGVAACLLMLAVPYDRLVRWRYVFYGVGLVLLLAVLAVGVGGLTTYARRWIRIGGFKVQPSEFMKVIMVLTLAGYIRYQRSYRRFTGLALPFALTLVPVFLIMKEPDLGTALLLIPLLFVLLYVAGARPRHLLVVAGAGLVAGLVLYFVPPFDVRLQGLNL
ncbi:MAG: FtsW/RodA/SpoVE family cell cycle protein, partial [Planctomycetota bacterium]